MYRLLLVIFFIPSLFFSQDISRKLDQAVQEFLRSDAAFAASISFYVSDEQGNMIFDYQGNKGFSSASTQKIFTAAAALQTLGKEYRYITKASYSGEISKGQLSGNLFITSNGDPTLGSWRYDGWKPEDFKNKFVAAMKTSGIKEISGNLILDDSYFDFQTVPGGWPWDDMGNYYGAGVWSINWRENQFDMKMKGNSIQGFNIKMDEVKWINEVKTGGNSDQSLIFTAPYSQVAYINGTLPSRNITVSGAMPNPPYQLGTEMMDWLKEAGIKIHGKAITTSQLKIEGQKTLQMPENNVFFTYHSPTLDKIVYWFLKKSVNLYGETFIKTMAKEKKGTGSFDVGVAYLKEFWKGKGIHPSTINFADGSGLSPQNYVSAKAEVQALLWSKKQPWFNSFFTGFPEYNGMKMKSGTIKNTKSFAGYHTSSAGKPYVFAVIIHNYQGAKVSEALYQLLNHLK